MNEALWTGRLRVKTARISFAFKPCFTNSLVSFLGRCPQVSPPHSHIPRCLFAANDYLDLFSSFASKNVWKKKIRKYKANKKPNEAWACVGGSSNLQLGPASRSKLKADVAPGSFAPPRIEKTLTVGCRWPASEQLQIFVNLTKRFG